jgi:glycosyltransferase involved in cell wall biosynthesis|tara:strand:- start:6686 stop:7285 length:600 start_codon:yes stop_codon:yes gene_type:complete
LKISVIVTNYNYEKWLRRCIRSLINQSFDDYEIIIIDDFSTDNSRNILLEYQDVDKIKLVFNKSNVGVGCSSTIGAKKATGKYIVRVDADDYVHNDFLKCLYLWASFNNSHAVACDYQEVNFNEDVLNTKSQDKNPLACGILYRTDLLEYLSYWDEKLRINEDVDMIKRFKKEFKLEYINIPLYRYFKHGESMTHGGRD